MRPISLLIPTALSSLILTALPCFAASDNILLNFNRYTNAMVTVEGIQITSIESSAPPQRVATPEGIAEVKSQRAGVYQQTGAGVVLDPQGYIVTNTHVIYGSQYIRVIFQDGTRLNAAVVYVSPAYDFSLLKVDPVKPLSAISWADSDKITLGQDIVTIGHSELLHNTLSGGRVIGSGARTTDNGETIELIELNINHYPGDSGGPVFDRAGQFLGLLNAKRLRQDRASFAVPSNKIHLAYLNLAHPAQNK